jgi:hypothetical protein
VKALLSLTLVLVLSSTTAPSWAQDDNDPEATPETETALNETQSESDDVVVVVLDEEGDGEEASLIAPFSVSLGIDNVFSIGALLRDEFTVTNYNLMVFGLSGTYSSDIAGLSASLSMSLTKFLTESGGSVFQNEARFGDISLSGSYGGFVTEENTGISLSASLSARIPTSDASRFTNLVTAVSPGLSLSRSFGSLSLRYGFGFKYNFYENTSVVADLEDYDIAVLARDGGSENIGEAQIALDTGVLTEYSFRNSLSMTYGWFEGFSTTLSFSLADAFTYDNGTITADDEFTSEFAVPGRGHSQTMTGSISASYSFADYFSAGLSLSTTQLPLTADNQSVRFPFFDLETGNLSNTEMGISLGASY